jgi:hypothetical protein
VSRRRHKNQQFRDKKKGNNNDRRDNFGQKKFGNDVRVVTTNVVRDNTKEDQAKKPERPSFKKESFRKDNFRKDNFKKDNNKKDNFRKDVESRGSNRFKAQEQRPPRAKRTIIPYTIKFPESTVCMKCGKKIEDMASAILDNVKNEYCHFDCIAEEIKKDVKMSGNQRFVYLGSGAFAVIEDIFEDGKKRFIIKNKIQYTIKE